MTGSFPGERASALSDNVAKQGEKIVKQKFRAVREIVSYLYSPEDVRLRGGIMGFIGVGMGGVWIDFDVVVRGKAKEVFGEGGWFRVIGENKIVGDD